MKTLLLRLSLVSGLVAAVAWTEPASPFKSGDGFVISGPIDTLLAAGLAKEGLTPAGRCSDQVFCRRVYLDITGTLPEPEATRRFFESDAPDRRALLIDQLLKSDEFSDFWTLKWCDLLRVKAEFPINLWPNGVQAYARWIHDAVQTNMPYDQFARALLTSSGSNFRVPPVNFYRAMQGTDKTTIATAVALTFMGTRLEKWPDSRRSDMESFFSRVAFKGTAEWKEVIVLPDPAATGPLQATFPDGQSITIAGSTDPREAFADWLIRPENEWFCRSIANRVWSWFMGRGIIHEPDDLRAGNPPVQPELLAHLENELVKSGYDLQHLFRIILNSSAYQQSSIPVQNSPLAEVSFAHYPVRRLDAEVLVDALCWLSGSHESYTSAIPEPFSFIPENARTVQLVDGSITSPFLKLFGRPARDTGLESERSCEVSDEQRLYLLNSTHIKDKIEKSWRLKQLMKQGNNDSDQMTRQVYLTVMSRYPTTNELSLAAEHFKTNGTARPAVVDLIWALVNSKEFLYRH